MPRTVTVALVPLDNRPCCLVFPQRLAEAAGVELHLPPRARLGHFFTPGQPDGIAQWMRALPEQTEVVIVALDMLAYGGLLASRAPDTSAPLALARLGVLNEVRAASPDLAIFAHSTILRTSLSTRDPETRRVHTLLHRYSILADEAQQQATPEVEAELAEVTSALPAMLLNTYLEVRQRNHRVNCEAIRMTANGTLDSLLLLVEDVGPGGHRYGLHRHEQAALGQDIANGNLQGRVFLHNGADEGGQVLLARAINRARVQPLTLQLLYSASDGATQVATFEDRPLGENIVSQVNAAGARITDQRPDALLAVHAPYGQAPDLAAFADAVAGFVTCGVPVGLVDTSTNGGDEALIAALTERLHLDDLTAYAAWNTASNALGTVLAHLSAALAPTASSPEASQRFLIERVLDDYLYQTRVRSVLNAHLEAQGLNPLDLGSHQRTAEARLRDLMSRELAELQARNAFRSAFTAGFALPWPRTFEVVCNVRLTATEPARKQP